MTLLHKLRHSSLRRKLFSSSFRNYRTKPFTSNYSERELLQLLEPELQITSIEDWYSQTRSNVKAIAFSKFNSHVQKAVNLLFQKYNKSLLDVLKAVYNDVKWDPMRFKRVRRYYFNQNHLQLFISEMEKELKITKLEDWYHFHMTDVGVAARRVGMSKHYASIRRVFKSNLMKTLQLVHSAYPWEEYKFKRASKTAYLSKQVHRKVFKEIERHLGIKTPEDWYPLQLRHLYDKLQGTQYLRKSLHSTVRKYGSLPKTLMAIFPEYNLERYLFKRMDAEQATSLPPPAVAKQVVQMLEEKLYIQSHEDWYRVSKMQLIRFSKFHMIHKMGGIQQLLSMVYPDRHWQFETTSSRANAIVGGSKKSEQRLLVGALRKLLGPSVTIIEEYVFDELTMPNSNSLVQLDIYLPEYRCGIEYNGKHHYQDVNVFGSFRLYEMRDKEKESVCAANGVTILTVPYTWDGSLEQVADMLKRARPDIPHVVASYGAAAAADSSPLQQHQQQLLLPNLLRVDKIKQSV